MQNLWTLVIFVAVLEAGTNASDLPLIDRLKFSVYTRDNPSAGQIVEPTVESIIRNVYSPRKPTVIAIHDWTGAEDAPETRAIVAAKLAHDDCNVIVADYSDVASESYYESFVAAPRVGVAIAELIAVLHTFFDVPHEHFHVVGFGLGAQIAGFAGQAVATKTQQKVGRLTALDPEGPGFNTLPATERLSADDAQFVEVVHTNGGGWGYYAPCGHADYYPNGGRMQPNCAPADDVCAHNRAYELLGEMWSPENDFYCDKCRDSEHISAAACRWSNVRMGENVREHGVFRLQTQGEPPYALGSLAYSFL